MSEVLSRLFFAGFVRLHILYHAAQEPICGVEITSELARHGYRLSPGTLYPALGDLEEAGYLLGWSKVVAGKQRKYYNATTEGRQALIAAKEKLRELAAEVLEDRQEGGASAATLRAADLAMDLLERRVTRGGIEIALSQREFELLHYLLRHKNATVTRSMLQRDVWKENGINPPSNTVAVFIGFLRRKIEKPGRPKLIHTLKNTGYVLRG